MGNSQKIIMRPGGLAPPDAKIPFPTDQDHSKSIAFPRTTSSRANSQYTAHNLYPAYKLHYDWTGWSSKGTNLPPQTADVASVIAADWETDGLRLMESGVKPDMIQILFSVRPIVSPVFFCQRVKGRLQNALRKAGAPVDFSRKLSFRSLGENTSPAVEQYLRGQTSKEDFADPRFREIMRQFTMINENVKLAEPAESNSGRYWYNLHVVLVTANRLRITNPETLGRIRDAAAATALEDEHRIAALAVMPDHVHLALRGNINRSPQEIALLFQNSLALAAGCRAWQNEFYAGTFSEYDLDVIRRIAQRS